MTEPKIPMDRLLSQKKPVTAAVQICMDSELAEELATANTKVSLLELRVQEQRNDRALVRELEDARAEADEIRERVKEQTVQFKFKSLGRKRFEDLVDEHPATKEQREDARKNGLDDNLQFNVDSFPIALIAKCCIEPEGIDEDTVKQIWQSDDWNDAELSHLFETALGVNQRRRVVDLGKDFRSMINSNSSSPTSSPSESPTPSS